MTKGYVGHDGPEPEPLLCWDQSSSSFRVERPFRYQDPDLGVITTAHPDRKHLTDLASVPWFTAWLVPVVGRHVLASLLHDALIGSDPGRPTYITDTGSVVSRHDADRVFLDAMKESEVPLVRRQMMWSAVSLITAFEAGRRARLWKAVAVLIGLLVALDVVDVIEPSAWSWWPLFSVPEAGFFQQWGVGIGIVAAVLGLATPLLLPWRHLRAGLIQAVVAGLVFLPVVIMLPIWLLLSKLPGRVSRR